MEATLNYAVSHGQAGIECRVAGIPSSLSHRRKGNRRSRSCVMRSHFAASHDVISLSRRDNYDSALRNIDANTSARLACTRLRAKGVPDGALGTLVGACCIREPSVSDWLCSSRSSASSQRCRRVRSLTPSAMTSASRRLWASCHTTCC